MLKHIHAAITRRALGETFSPRALEVIVAANVGQDALSGQVGHDEFHFDNNAFERSRAYIEAQRGLIRPALEGGDAESARRAFGRLTHAAQDFYAHSNYIDLWRSSRPDRATVQAEALDPFDPAFLDTPALRSGRLYYPLEALYFVIPLRKLVMPLLPRDSHAWMNLDSAERGPMFEYAYQAAVKRTRYEYDLSTRGFSVKLNASFTGVSKVA